VEISAEGLLSEEEAMPKKLVRRYGFRVRDPGVSIGRDAFEKVQETYDTDGEFCDQVSEAIPACVHGHAIHNPQEIGGTCICGRLLCKECAQLRCHIDGYVLCRDHAIFLNGKAACVNHNLVRLALFSIARAFERE